MNTYNLLLRLTDGTTEALEFTGQTPSTVAAAVRRVEIDHMKRVEAVAVLLPPNPAMVWLPRYEEWWHLLPEHVRKTVAEPQFTVETQRPPAPPKPLDPPSAAATEVGPAQMSREQATASGYTGDSCVRCGSMRMKHTGHCNTCEECGETTGCS